MVLASLLAGSVAYNLPFRQPTPSTNTATYAISVSRLTYGQQVAELERLGISPREIAEVSLPLLLTLPLPLTRT